MEKSKRYLMLAVGLFLTGFGIAAITVAGLGTTPISSIPYTMSLMITNVTLGTFTALFNILLIVLQVIIAKERLSFMEYALQGVMSLILGYVIDISLFILKPLELTVYWQHLLTLILGCAVMALGIFIQILSGVVMAPGDSFTKCLSQLTGKEYGTVRVMSDMTMALIAAIACFIVFHKFISVREGTIITAFLVGMMINGYRRLYGKMRKAS